MGLLDGVWMNSLNVSSICMSFLQGNDCCPVVYSCDGAGNVSFSAKLDDNKKVANTKFT